MRDNYVGDIGDYYKYSLLRRLCGHDPISRKMSQSIGVVWYLYPDPCRPNDGQHLDYLQERNLDKYRPTDPSLYDALSSLIAAQKRSVLEIEQSGILPNAKFFCEPLSFDGMPKGTSSAIATRLEHRQRWLDRALAATEHCDWVFFDPDNGLEVKSTAKHHDKGPKFCFYDELRPFWDRGQNLIIYQHKNLHQTAQKQINERIAELSSRFPSSTIQHHYYPSHGGRIFFVVTHK